MHVDKDDKDVSDSHGKPCDHEDPNWKFQSILENQL